MVDPEYLQYVDPEGQWPDLCSLLLVETERRVGDQVGTETRYFISSHPPEARHLLATTRTHWRIENSLHWVLDVAFREDESRVRTGHAPRNLGLLRRLALNLLRQDTTVKAGVAIPRRKAGRNLAYMEQVLGLAQSCDCPDHGTVSISLLLVVGAQTTRGPYHGVVMTTKEDPSSWTTS